jgi:ribose transport system ATP-binding protein
MVLEAVGVAKTFADVPALRGTNFMLERGQVHGLAGVRGAGKSTLIKVLTGVHEPDRGMIFHRGVPARFHHPREAQAAGISAVHQEDNLVDSISVAANLYLGRERRTRFGLVDSRRMSADATRLLESLDIPVDPHRKLRSLRPGTKQMIAIARVMDIDARIVLLDEPTTSLEPYEVETLRDLIRWWQYRGVSVVYASSRVDELYPICDTVTVLCDGLAVHTGPLADLSRLELAATMLGRELTDHS